MQTQQTPVTPVANEEEVLDKKKKNKKAKPKRTVGQEIISWIMCLLAAVLIASCVRAFIFEPIVVDGNSMNNTLLNGEVMLCTKYDYLLGSPQRGDVVVCRYPGRSEELFSLGAALGVQNHTLFVKRLVALPGDAVAISEGKLYVNDKPVEDPELMASLPYASYPRTVMGADEYFVMGDNRGNSHDSRAADVGPISRSAIMAHVRSVILPLNKIRGVN